MKAAVEPVDCFHPVTVQLPGRVGPGRVGPGRFIRAQSVIQPTAPSHKRTHRKCAVTQAVGLSEEPVHVVPGPLMSTQCLV